jgi:mannose/fructose/N-acetylgalactosamine-specific phosphotransferase system component IID
VRLRRKIGELDIRTLTACFLRCYCIGAAYNTRGLQHVGLAFAMEPGLNVIYPDPERRAEVWPRYLKLYNTHFFWTPLLVGLFLSLEVKIAQGVAPAEMLDNVKTTTAFTLSAIGDTFFSASLMGLWGLSAACLVAGGQYTILAVLVAVLFTAVQIFKVMTFLAGYREGFSVLRRIRRWNLVNLGRRVKMVNALLLAALWIMTQPWGGMTGSLADAILVGVLAVWAATRPAVSREIALLVVAGSWIALRSLWPL